MSIITELVEYKDKMIPISKVANSIEPSLIRSIFNLAKTMDDVVDFTLGDPDVQPHQAIKDAGCAAIQQGKTRYSQNAGLLALRQAISEYYQRKEGLSYQADGELIMSTMCKWCSFATQHLSLSIIPMQRL